MKSSHKLLLAVSGGILAAIAITLLVVFFLSPSVLEVTVQDAISGAAIPDLTITLGNRIILGSHATTHQFTNLSSGEYELVAKAPNYREERVKVSVGAGLTRLPKPIELTCTSLPAFNDFFIEEKEIKDGVGLFIRPARIVKAADEKDNTAEWIPFPGVDVVMAFRISEQWKDGKMLEAPVSSESVRGQELFSGVVSESFEEIQGAKYAFAGTVKMEKIKSTPAKYWVIDCLLLIPIPGKASHDELQKILDGVSAIKDDTVLRKYLTQYSDKVAYTYHAVWNVQNPATRTATLQTPQAGVLSPVSPSATVPGTEGGKQ
ncbi:MAG: carboxypeptidase regulatory-like domain-containing protein [Spirochaetaceae bacterium]|nr:MAG: carboxypeptidase regulatory-like domain-containing protein [Spirochaetaceae bacterium]